MFQTRFHGRGGQGVVTAAEMLSVAAFLEKRHAQAFPSFGSERMGAPVTSFCRIDDKEIRLRDPIDSPDALIIQDQTLLQTPGLFTGLSEAGFVLINSGHDLSTFPKLPVLPEGHLMALPATELALKHIKRPLPNAVMLGGFAALTDVVKLESVLAAIEHAFSGSIAAANVAAAKEAFELVRLQKSRPQPLKKARAC